jgi:serine/threonine protein kinase
MLLSAGARLGPYEILSALGAGGMGEVYRALDTKLKRDVALKVLPQAFAQDPDRLARFQREAELLATLDHPNVAAIFSIEEADGVRFMTMELVGPHTGPDDSHGRRLDGSSSTSQSPWPTRCRRPIGSASSTAI